MSKRLVGGIIGCKYKTSPWHLNGFPDGSNIGSTVYIYIFFSSLISLIADGPHHYHPACGHKGSSHLSPVHALQFFYRDASSALLQLVNQLLNFTYSRSHAFRYERKNTNPTLVRIEYRGETHRYAVHLHFSAGTFNMPTSCQ